MNRQVPDSSSARTEGARQFSSASEALGVNSSEREESLTSMHTAKAPALNTRVNARIAALISCRIARPEALPRTSSYHRQTGVTGSGMAATSSLSLEFDNVGVHLCRWVGFAALALALGSVNPVLAQAGPDEESVFDQVTECDVLAAHPEDPQRVSEGVTDERLVPRLATQACEKAAKATPSEVRFVFQLGRAHWSAGRREAAKAHFERASAAGYAAADAYLGDIYQFGTGAAQDSAKALEHYKRAVSRGFNGAKDQIEQLTFVPSLFVSGSIGMIYGGEYDKVLAQSDPLLRNYLYHFVQQIVEECGAFLKPPSVVRYFLYRYPYNKGWTVEQDENIGVAIQTSVGEYDANIFLKRYGCEGPVAKQLFSNFDSFFGRL
jgi:tetratricopeptide (TPR) repeat protein